MDSTEIVFPLSDCAIKKDNFETLSPTTIYKILKTKTIAIYLLTPGEIDIMKPQDNKLKIILYSKISLRFGVKIREKYMQENLQDQNISPIQSQPVDNQVENKKKQWVKITLFTLLGFALLGGVFYAGVRFGEKQKIVNQGQNENLPPSPTNRKETEIKPDKKIAFLKGNGVNEKEAEIWTVGIDGSGETTTGIKLKNGQNFSSFHQSPDMNYTCFTDGDLEKGEEIYLFDLRKNEVKQISNSFFKETKEYDGSWIMDCGWSLDSSKFGYQVSHHPQESTPGGGLPEKELPPAQFNIKMGSFIYLIDENKLEKISDELITNYATFRLNGPEWNRDLQGNYFFDNTYAGGAKLMFKKDSLEEILIWEGNYYIGQPPPLQLSPDENKIVFTDTDGVLIVFNVNNPSNLRRFEGTRVDGMWSKYEWLSNTEILFWQSRAGHKYSTEGGSWYQGNLLVLDTQTNLIKKLTEDNSTFWRQ